MGAYFSRPNHGLPDLRPLYIARKKLGDGAEGEVWLCEDVHTMELTAVKLIKRGMPPWKKDMISAEVQILAELGESHKNIITPRELFLTRHWLGVVTELVPGGTLADYCKVHHITEDLACYFFRQLIGAVEYLHAHHVAHRDLKLENVLLDRCEPPRLQICDFGTARHWANEAAHMSGIAGTPGYFAPEMLDGIFRPLDSSVYDATKSDVWSCGVILCVMLLHHFPYEFDDILQYLPTSEAVHQTWNLQNKTNWEDSTNLQEAHMALTPELKDLLSRIFVRDHSKRISISGIKAHSWMTRKLPNRLQSVLDQLAKEQLALDKAMAAGVWHNVERDDAIEHVLQLASQQPERTLSLRTGSFWSGRQSRTSSAGPPTARMVVNTSQTLGDAAACALPPKPKGSKALEQVSTWSIQGIAIKSAHMDKRSSSSSNLPDDRTEGLHAARTPGSDTSASAEPQVKPADATRSHTTQQLSPFQQPAVQCMQCEEVTASPSPALGTTADQTNAPRSAGLHVDEARYDGVSPSCALSRCNHPQAGRDGMTMQLAGDVLRLNLRWLDTAHQQLHRSILSRLVAASMRLRDSKRVRDSASDEVEYLAASGWAEYSKPAHTPEPAAAPGLVNQATTAASPEAISAASSRHLQHRENGGIGASEPRIMDFSDSESGRSTPRSKPCDAGGMHSPAHAKDNSPEGPTNIASSDGCQLLHADHSDPVPHVLMDAVLYISELHDAGRSPSAKQALPGEVPDGH